MEWTQKIASFLGLRGKATDVIVEGGFDVLPRFTGFEMNKKNYLEQYVKSLYVFACISKIAGKTASINLKLYRVLNSRGDTKEVLVHPALDLLYKPNPFQTKTEFLETTMINLKTTGDAYWYKVRNKGGRVVELWNLRPDMIVIVTDPEKFIKEYRFSKQDGTVESFAPEEIVHFKYPDPLNLYLGLSPLRASQTEVQTNEYIARYQRDFFLNNARPDAIIKNKNSTLTVEQKEELKEGWEKRYKGLGKNSKISILKGDLEYQQISLNQRDMDYIESKKFTRDDILVAFQVPKVILSIVEDVNRANAETGMYIFLAETIKPEMDRLVEKLNEEMIYPDFGDDLFFGFENPVPENRTQIVEEYKAGIQFNYLLINEVRQKEGLPPVNGGWSFYMPVMNAPVGGLPASAQPKQLDLNEEMIKIMIERGKKKETETPVYNFKGRFWLHQKFTIMEELKRKIIMKRWQKKEEKNQTKQSERKIIKIKKNKTEKEEEEKTGTRSFLETAELKKTYFDMINKKIDVKIVPLREAANAFFGLQKERILEEFKKVVKPKSLKKKDLKVSQFFNEEKEVELTIAFITPYLQNYLEESADEAMDMVAPAEEFNTTQAIKKRLEKRAEAFGKEVTATTIDKLNNTLAQGIEAAEGITDLTNRVSDVYEEFPMYRSELIARTEATAANNEGMIEAFKQSNVANGKEWINAGDDRVREEHQDEVGVGGEIVGLDAKFSNGLAYPQEPNCRCVIGPAFVEE